MKRSPYSEKDQLNLKVIIALSRSRNYISKKENPLFKKYGLTVSQFGVLELLYHKGASRIKTIIEKTLSTGGNMTVVIDNLEKCELVKRIPDPDDRRALLISLTEKGTNLIKEAFQEHLINLENILDVLNEEEKKTLTVILRKFE